MLPAIMAIWFVPALIILLKVDAIESIKLSFKGCLRNFLPYLLYSLVALVLLLVIVALFAGVFASFNLSDTQPQNFPIALWFIIGGFYFLMAVYGAPIVFCSIYSSFDDIYHLQQETTVNEALNSSELADETSNMTPEPSEVAPQTVSPPDETERNTQPVSEPNNKNNDSPVDRK